MSVATVDRIELQPTGEIPFYRKRRTWVVKRRITASCPESMEAECHYESQVTKMDIDTTEMIHGPANDPPIAYKAETIERERMVDLVATAIHKWVDNAPTAPTNLFTGRASVSMQQFVSALLELLDYLRCDSNVLLTALCYIRRLGTSYPVCSLNIFRLLLSSILAAIKFSDDVGITNVQFAQLVGLEVRDIMALEINFLPLIRYELYVREQEFVELCNEVHSVSTSPAQVA